MGLHKVQTNRGSFKKGECKSPKTQFKKGEHKLYVGLAIEKGTKGGDYAIH